VKVARVPFRLGPGECFQTPLLRAEFRLCMLDTLDWCLPRADSSRPRDCLRCPELRPYLFNESRYESVHDAAWARHLWLADSGIAERFPHRLDEPEVEHDSKRQIPARMANGRLLVWYRDLTVDDGLGESCTQGYLDESDMPPWDTWIYYIRAEDDPKAAAGYLVSWVPPQFVQPVQEAIACNAYDALLWLRGSELCLEAVALDEQVLV
jgi:hypothetical protein